MTSEEFRTKVKSHDVRLQNVAGRRLLQTRRHGIIDLLYYPLLLRLDRSGVRE